MPEYEETMDDSDLAVAIGEHAFRAGYEAALAHAQVNPETLHGTWYEAWSEYDPPEELKGRSFT